MKVYVVHEQDDHGIQTILGVFSKRELAEDCENRSKKYWFTSIHIDEYILDDINKDEE